MKEVMAEKSKPKEMGWDYNGSALSRKVFRVFLPTLLWEEHDCAPYVEAWCSSVSLYLPGSAPGGSPGLPISGEIAHLPLSLSVGVKGSVFVWSFSWGQFSLGHPTRN